MGWVDEKVRVYLLADLEGEVEEIGHCWLELAVCTSARVELEPACSVVSSCWLKAIYPVLEKIKAEVMRYRKAHPCISTILY